MHVHQRLHAGGKILGCASVGDLDVPPALQWLEAHVQVARPLPAIFVVVPHRLTGSKRQGLTDLTDPLVQLFIKTDQRIPGIIRLRIEV